MTKFAVKTSLGDVAVFKNEVVGTVPIVFLHGVYFDHHLWDAQIKQIEDQTVIAVDMPMHGESQNITKKDWGLADCALALLDVLDQLKIDKVFAIGHSWGSMTIIRAAAKQPERFVKLGLCNMPLAASKSTVKTQLFFQHLLLPFRAFYTKQVAKALFSKASLEADSSLFDDLSQSFGGLSSVAIKQTDKAVLAEADDGFSYLEQLQMPIEILKGEKDYVPEPEGFDVLVVSGGHSSPIEQPEAVTTFVKAVIA